MSAAERAILDALEDLERAAAASRPRTEAVAPSSATPILPILERLDRLTAELPAHAPSDLRHFLQRKSYEKARQFLLGRQDEIAPGRCGS